MRKKFGFFPFEAMNYKAGQAYLDRKAAQGWRLRHIYLGCIALFEAGSGPRHFVDLDIRQFMDEEPDQDYLQLCADAGWEHIQTLRGMLLFRAAEGQDPTPIQSDGGIEWERFWGKYARKNLITTTLVLLAAAALVWLCQKLSPGPGRSAAAFVTSNSALVYLFALAVGLLSILFSLVGIPLYLLRCRRSGQMETPGRVWAWVQDAPFRLFRPLYILAALLAILELSGAVGTPVDLGWSPITGEYTATVETCRQYPVVMASDLGLRDSEDSRYLEGHRSPLAEFWDYSELTDGDTPEAPLHILTTERYDCAGEWLARRVFDLRSWETRSGAFLWGELEWEPSPGLGFEESYTCREGEYLLLRQDNVVALVGCRGLDLTTPERLAVIRTRLGL